MMNTFSLPHTKLLLLLEHDLIPFYLRWIEVGQLGWENRPQWLLDFGHFLGVLCEWWRIVRMRSSGLTRKIDLMWFFSLFTHPFNFHGSVKGYEKKSTEHVESRRENVNRKLFTEEQKKLSKWNNDCPHRLRLERTEEKKVKNEREEKRSENPWNFWLSKRCWIFVDSLWNLFETFLADGDLRKLDIYFLTFRHPPSGEEYKRIKKTFMSQRKIKKSREIEK